MESEKLDRIERGNYYGIGVRFSLKGGKMFNMCPKVTLLRDLYYRLYLM